MRNNIISLEKYFSIFAYLSIWAKYNAKKNVYIEFSQIAYSQTADRKAKIEKYFSKEIILFLIYLGIYFLVADKGIWFKNEIKIEYSYIKVVPLSFEFCGGVDFVGHNS